MEDVEQSVESSESKALKLAKLSLLISVIAIAGLGYLYFESQKALSQLSGDALKQTIKTEATNATQDLQSQIMGMADKNAELEVKIAELGGSSNKMAELEMKLNQFEVDLQKNASLRSRIAELESKRGKVGVAPKAVPKLAPKTTLRAAPKKVGKPVQPAKKKKK